MKTSEKGVAFIAAHEGLVTRAYRDVAGVWTIGFGHTSKAGAPKVTPNMTITLAQARSILATDLARFEARVRKVGVFHSQTGFDGAVSFDFNTGAIHRASWVKQYARGNYSAARLGLMRWANAGGRRVAGLVRRRRAEAELILGGKYGETSGSSYVSGSSHAAGAGDDIRQLQKDLTALGLDPGPIDGVQGSKTRAAIRRLQKLHENLVVDGIAGPASRAAIQRMLRAKKIKQDSARAAGAGGVFWGAAALWTQALRGGVSWDFYQVALWGVIGGLGFAGVLAFQFWRRRYADEHSLLKSLARKD